MPREVDAQMMHPGVVFTHVLLAVECGSYTSFHLMEFGVHVRAHFSCGGILAGASSFISAMVLFVRHLPS